MGTGHASGARLVRVLLMGAVGLAAGGRALTAAAGPPPNAPFVVDWLLDEADAILVDGICLSTPGAHCTLRAAVQQANYNAGADTIVLGSGFYVLNRVGADDTSVAGDLDINSEMTIIGAGMSNTTIVMDGAATNERVLHVRSGQVRLEALGLTGGRGDGGGGILNVTILTLDHTRIFSNTTIHDYAGGGITNFGGLTLVHSVVEFNQAVFGGGLYNNGDAWIEASTIANNAATYSAGGGINNVDDMIMLNSTVSGNSSISGGSGLDNESPGFAVLYNVTIALNQANVLQSVSGTHAGVVNHAGATLYVQNSIIARNYELVGFQRYYKDCDGTLTIYGNAYFMPLGFYPPSSGVAPCAFSLTSGSNAYINMRPSDLGLLANNGGAAPTHDLDPGSAAYDGGDALNGCLDFYSNLLVADQRGAPRVHGVRCDAGAVEHGSLWELFAPLVRR